MIICLVYRLFSFLFTYFKSIHIYMIGQFIYPFAHESLTLKLILEIADLTRKCEGIPTAIDDRKLRSVAGNCLVNRTLLLSEPVSSKHCNQNSPPILGVSADGK